MSLTGKIVAVIAVTSIVTVCGLGAVAIQIVLGEFAELERTIAEKDTLRVRNALFDEVAGIDTTCGDWAPWNDTHSYILGTAPDYVTDNLDVATLSNLGVSFMAFFDARGELVHIQYIDLDEKIETEAPAEIYDAIISTPTIFQHSSKREGQSGVLLAGRDPYLVASWAITDNEHTLPASGTLIIGRKFSASQIKRLANRTRENVSFFLVGDPALPPEVLDAAGRIASTDSIHVTLTSRNTLAAYAGIPDIRGRPVAVLRVLSPRAIFREGVTTAWTFVVTFLIAGVLTIITLIVLLHRVAVNPIARLREHVTTIAETKDLTRQFDARTNDEVGQLADAFNDMARNLDMAQSELKDTHQKLMIAAREAGMAEVASGVLHNVGNVLNSVNTCVAMMRKQAGESRIENLGKTLDLIDERKDDLAEFLTHDERGQKVLPYLRCLAERLSEERDETAATLRNLTRHVEHIIEIVSLQQSVAKSAGVVEPVVLNEVIADAAAICSESLNRHHVELAVECADLPPVRLDRHQVLQILVNLISNAKYATSAGGNGHRVAVRLYSPDSDNVRIEVSDNGIGIRKEDMTRIFAHGFTTRKDGHGFGLHSAALAAQQLGGSLVAASDGIGQGATFTLTLPARAEGRSHRGRD